MINLANMNYPGRVIILGKSLAGEEIVMYAITGRSPSSQARILEKEGDKVFVKPTDEEVLKTGNPDLLIYPALVLKDKGIIVSNGKHTEDIFPNIEKQLRAVELLDSSLNEWKYEPDEPAYTPRISGCVSNGAALSIIKRAEDGTAIRYYFDVSLIPGKGKLITTYTGENKNPLPSFYGEPLDVNLPYKNAEEAVEELYKSLGPGKDGDFRVAAAAVYREKKGSFAVAIKNRQT